MAKVASAVLLPDPEPAETKRQKFKRIAKRRLDIIVKAIDVLANIGRNRSAYEYDEDDINLIIDELAGEIEALRDALLPRRRKVKADCEFE